MSCPSKRADCRGWCQTHARGERKPQQYAISSLLCHSTSLYIFPFKTAFLVQVGTVDNQSPGIWKGSQFDSRTCIDISFQNVNALWIANSTRSTSVGDLGKEDYISTRPSRKLPALYFGLLSRSSQSLATCMDDTTLMTTAICWQQLCVLPVLHLKNRKL